MNDMTRERAKARVEDSSLGQWIKLGVWTTIVVAGGAYFVASTDGVTLVDKFVSSMAGVIGAGFLLTVIFRLIGGGED